MLQIVAPIARSAAVLMPILLGAAFVHAQSVVGAKAGIVQYVEYVLEIASHPNYDAALAALKRVAGK